eukprot:11859589-Alexandrium_andersonii.AAC.1
MAVDTLHTLNLGVYQEFVRYSLWKLLEANVFKVTTKHGQDQALQLQVLELRSALLSWYQRNRELGLTEVQDVQLSMLGTRDRPLAKFKGAETKGVLLFCIDLLS